MSKQTNNNLSNKKKLARALAWMLLIVLTGFIILILISPASKALPVFLIGFLVTVIIIVLLALYINYIVNMFKQIREK